MPDFLFHSFSAPLLPHTALIIPFHINLSRFFTPTLDLVEPLTFVEINRMTDECAERYRIIRRLKQDLIINNKNGEAGFGGRMRQLTDGIKYVCMEEEQYGSTGIWSQQWLLASLIRNGQGLAC